jgi:hypothetical protein
MITTEAQPYYADLDEDTNMWCVFSVHDMRPFAYSTWADEESAIIDAIQRNVLFSTGRNFTIQVETK